MKTISRLEKEYGQTFAIIAIIAIVTYLVIVQ